MTLTGRIAQVTESEIQYLWNHSQPELLKCFLCQDYYEWTDMFMITRKNLKLSNIFAPKRFPRYIIKGIGGSKRFKTCLSLIFPDATYFWRHGTKSSNLCCRGVAFFSGYVGFENWKHFSAIFLFTKVSAPKKKRLQKVWRYVSNNVLLKSSRMLLFL